MNAANDSRNILDRIKETKLVEVAAAQLTMPVAELRAACAEKSPPRGFARALRGDRGPTAPRTPGRLPRVVAEVKKASPSAGVIRPDFDPAKIALSYERHGAAAISCLTDTPWFQGSLDALRAVRGAVKLPVLRKEFMLDPYQVWEARAAGADAILLIAGFVEWSMQRRLADTAREAGLDVLLEIHGVAELEPALALGPDVLGINNRNLRTPNLVTDLSISQLLVPQVPPELTLISESGIRTAEDVQTLAALGIDAILVGEHLMRTPDPGQAIHTCLGL
jgi:indole-3-glycerol phosphate synthase